MVFPPASNGLPTKVAIMPSIKRRANGAAVSASPRSGQRLSQASLQKAFFSMLGCVSIVYFLFIFLFFRRHDLRVYRDRGSFNHSIRSSSNTAEAWKHHMEKLAREQDERQRLREQTIQVHSHHSDHKDLEQPDIEEMIRPEEIVRERKDGTQTAKHTSNQSQLAMTAFASSNFDNLLNAGSLTEIHFPKISTCNNLREESLEQEGLEDPFLPKLNSVVASSDGSNIQIAAQNPIQCRNETDASIIKKMHLQASLFQPVSVKRIEIDGETKYQVVSSPDKDDNIQGVVQTRFLCRFEPTGLETLSSFSQQDNTNNISASDANLFFQCPVPNELVPSLKQKLQNHSLEKEPDFTLTLVPFRTPPNVQSPEDAVPPCYLKPENDEDASKLRRKLKSEADFLPKIAEAARWENVPICLSDSKAT